MPARSKARRAIATGTIQRLGAFGGSFDPPHNGHVGIAAHAAERLGLQRVLLIPSAVPPHKLDRALSSPEDRLEMCNRAAAEHPVLAVSDIELRREGVSFTVDTLQELTALHPGGELFLLIGMDNYQEFNLWRNPARILELATLVVMDRPGYGAGLDLPVEGSRVRRVEVPQFDISSTEIRRLVRLGRPISHLVPQKVEEYIHARRLYR
jgi:nicotinate-nucleotide adenylyltransferase